MYITKQEIEKILAVMQEFPDATSYDLKSDNTSGIGCILTLSMEMKLNNHDALVTVEISGVENW